MIVRLGGLESTLDGSNVGDMWGSKLHFRRRFRLPLNFADYNSMNSIRLRDNLTFDGPLVSLK